MPALLGAARTTGATTSLDTNWDPSGRWGDQHLTAAMAQVTLLLPNEAGTLHLAARTVDAPAATHTLDAVARTLAAGPTLDAAARALAAGPTLVVKRGDRGALCCTGTGQQQVSLPPVVPVDTTGAGDCFNAGLIAGLLQGLPLPEAAALGCAAGALSTAAPGGTAAPSLPAATQLAQQATITPTAPAPRA